MILTKCPKCGGQLQLTRACEAWFSLVDGKWEPKGGDEVEVRVYCENDHQLTARDAVTALLGLPVREPV